MKSKTEYTLSSGNVFADLELSEPEDRMLKAQLAIQIRHFIEQKDWTQAEAAIAVGLDQPKISSLLRGRLAGFSIDRLFRILNRLGHRIEVKISRRETSPENATTQIKVA